MKLADEQKQEFENGEYIEKNLIGELSETKDVWWGILALIVIGALWAPKSDGEL